MATAHRGLGQQPRRGFMPGYRRGRGVGAPQLTHHAHSHPGHPGHPVPYPPAEFPPGAYPGDDSNDDDSGSPGDRIPSPPPGGRMMLPPSGVPVPPAGMAPMHLQPAGGRAMWDTMAAENHALREEASKLHMQMEAMAAGGQPPGWFGQDSHMAQQLNQANDTIQQKETELFELQSQMHELFTSTSAEIATLKAKLKEATDKHGEETTKMKENINGLTEYIASSKAEDGCIDDDYFKEELNKFGQALRNWVWKNCRGATLLPDMVEDEMVRAKIRFAVPEFSRLCISNSKITVMQAVVCDMLVRLVFRRYCVGLQMGEEQSLMKLEEVLTRHADGNPDNLGATTISNVHRWRALSIALLTDIEAIKANAEGSIVDTTSDIEGVVFSLIPPSKRPGEQASRQLIPLVSNAVRLSHMMKSQRARFDVISPMGHVFDPDWMEDASGMEDDADSELRGKMVGAVAFPAVIKYGNERGENYGKRTVISRAKVLCLLDND